MIISVINDAMLILYMALKNTLRLDTAEATGTVRSAITVLLSDKPSATVNV